MSGLANVAAYFKDNSKQLANQLVDDIIVKFPFTVESEEIDDAKKMYEDFFVFLGEAIPLKEDTDPESLIMWSKGNGEHAAAVKGKISMIISRYPDTRTVFVDYMLQIGLEYGLSTVEIVQMIKRVDHMLDLSVTETVFAFERTTEERLKQAQSVINELSSPIVPIQDGIAILPLIGAVDADRSQYLLNHVVPKVSTLSISNLIIDFSGIETIDTDVAGHIFNIHDVLRLLGINVAVTGIRADLASRVVREGIDFSSLNAYATVMHAIEEIKEDRL